jgi:hypothetical protein
MSSRQEPDKPEGHAMVEDIDFNEAKAGLTNEAGLDESSVRNFNLIIIQIAY